jgi:hypothetical protein
MLGNYASSILYLSCFLVPLTPAIMTHVCLQTRDPTKESTVTIMLVIHAPIVLILPLHRSTDITIPFPLALSSLDQPSLLQMSHVQA